MSSGAKGEVRLQELERAERALARRSAEARATIPDFELTKVLAVTDPPPGTAAVVRACALALRDVPRANGSYRDGRYELYSRVNVGVVLTTIEIPVVPTIFDADQKSLRELEAELDALQARAASLLAPELAGATFTVTDLGAWGVTSATPVLIPPQAAGLAVGAVTELPASRDPEVVLPSGSITLTLACDHRILYGAHAATLLTRICSHLQTEPG